MPSQVVLSPIQEMDALSTTNGGGGSGAGNTTAVSNGGGATALAQSVLSPTLKTIGISNISSVAMPVSPVTLSAVSMNPQLFTTVMKPSTTQPNNTTPLILTDVTHVLPDKEPNNSVANSSNVSLSSMEEKARKINLAQSPKSGEVYV